LAEERVRRAEEGKKRRQEQEAERLEQEAEKERELAEVPAFADEINVASNLVTFFQQLQGKTAAVETQVAETKEVEVPKGATALKSKAERLGEEAFFLGKSKKAKQPKETKAKSGVLKLDLSILDALWKLKLDVPANLDDVETTVKTLEEKKAKWVADQATATVAAKQKAEEKIAALRAKAAKMDEAKPVEVNGDE
jgi:hypothetical protein